MTTRTIPGSMPVGFRYTPGVANTRFFEALRDDGVLLGSRCDTCGVTIVPARLFCERCLRETPEAIVCGPEGTLVSWTVGHVDVDGEPLGQPIQLGLVRLDGADTVLMHRLDASDPEIGMRVRAVIGVERTGSILDIEGFTTG